MEIESFDPGSSAQQIFSALERDGAAIVRERVDASRLARLHSDLEPHLERREPGGGKFYGYKAKLLSSIFAKSAVLGELIADPLLLELADAVVRPNCNHYQVQVTGVLQVWKGGQLQPLHRDEDVYAPFLKHEPEHPQLLLSLLWALSDFSAENGATRLVPGSHRWERGRTAGEDETVQAIMPRGSVLVFLGSILHGMGINQTEEPRTGMVSGYSVGWLRQEENQYLAVPVELARSFPEQVQRLIGYQTHSPVLGWVDGQDPNFLVNPNAKRRPAGSPDISY